jgi:STE24 endopeptidase
VRRWWIASQVIDRLVLLLFWVVGLSGALAAWAQQAGWRPLQIAIYTLIAGVLYTLVLFPLRVHLGYRIPKQYGLLRQSFKGWLADAGKAGVLGAVFGLAAIEFLYLTVAVAPVWWWLLCGVAAALVTVGLGLVAPVVIAPLFFKFRLLDRPDIVSRIQDALARTGFRAQGVYEFDLSHKVKAANAAVFGFGPTRRIVLSDSLLSGYSPAEIEAVVTHELGHHVHKDMWWLTLAGAASMVVGLAGVALVFAVVPQQGEATLGNLAVMPLWILVFDLVTFVLSPLTLGLSRWSERRADAYARSAASEPAALATALHRLGDDGLADPAPPRWEVVLRYSHPPLYERTAHDGVER